MNVPIGRIDRYIMLNFYLGIVPMLLLLLGLFSFVEFSEALKSVGEGEFELSDAFKVVALTTPNRVVDLLPVTALMGGLMGFGAMANHQELVVLRTAGMSPWRIALPVWYAAITLVAASLLLQFLVIPGAERQAVQARSKSLLTTAVASGETLAFWTRSGRYLVRVQDVQFSRSLRNIEIYQLDAGGHLSGSYLAAQADIIGDEDWILTDVVHRRFHTDSITLEALASLHWRGLFSRKQTESLILPVQSLSPFDLLQYIHYLDGNKINTQRVETIFWRQVSVPISVVAMSLLSLPFLLGSMRKTAASQRVMAGGLVGMVFYLAQQITGNLAGLLNLEPAVMVMLPSVILLAFACLGICRAK